VSRVPPVIPDDAMRAEREQRCDPDVVT
jgi:hypothetical protein